MTPREMEIAFNRLLAEVDDCREEAKAAGNLPQAAEFTRAFNRLCKVQALLERTLAH